MITPLPHAPHGVRGRVDVPGSKSETNRALVMAALGDGPSTITGALASRDSELMIAALRTLGCEVTDRGDGEIVVEPAAFRGGVTIDCGLAGTVMRFVPPLALFADGPVTFTGDPHASERPMKGLLDGLRQLGADVDADRLPFTMTPPASVRGGEVAIDSSASSQFVSGLLLIGARLPGGLTVRHVGSSLPSRPHIRMTTEMLARRGVDVVELDERAWLANEGRIAALDSRVEPDLTNAAVFLAAAAVAGGEVSVPGWPAESIQPGALFLDVARRMGCEVSFDGETVTLRGAELRGIDVDLHAASELTPVVAALGAVAQGVTTIRGVGHIRGHETDRIAALLTELERAGIRAEELDDGLRITGGVPRAATFDTYADHRMVHFAALLGLLAEGSSVTDMACVSKTMPTFPTLWAAIA